LGNVQVAAAGFVAFEGRVELDFFVAPEAFRLAVFAGSRPVFEGVSVGFNFVVELSPCSSTTGIFSKLSNGMLPKERKANIARELGRVESIKSIRWKHGSSTISLSHYLICTTSTVIRSSSIRATKR
jgi:hypothetical protein